jgi:hypothetical protein
LFWTWTQESENLLSRVFRDLPVVTYLFPSLGFPDAYNLQPQLDCRANEVKVTLDKCLLGDLGFGEEVIAYLRDRNCSSIMQREDGNWMSVTSPVQASACGNILEVSGIYIVVGNYELRFRTLRQISRKQPFIVPAQTQRSHVQRLSPENKGVSPYIPLQIDYRSKKQSSTHFWLHVTLLAISSP